MDLWGNNKSPYFVLHISIHSRYLKIDFGKYVRFSITYIAFCGNIQHLGQGESNLQILK